MMTITWIASVWPGGSGSLDSGDWIYGYNVDDFGNYLSYLYGSAENDIVLGFVLPDPFPLDPMLGVGGTLSGDLSVDRFNIFGDASYVLVGRLSVLRGGNINPGAGISAGSGGLLSISGDMAVYGTATGITVIGVGAVVSVGGGSGITFDTTVTNGGSEFVYSGGTASGTVVNDGGAEFVYSGGTASGTVVNSGGNEFLNSGTSSDVTVNSGGTLSGYGLEYGPVQNDGQISADGGALVVSGAVSGTGVAQINNSATLELGGSVSKNITIGFNNNTGVLAVATLGAMEAAIESFQTGDTIDLKGVPSDEAIYDSGTGVLNAL